MCIRPTLPTSATAMMSLCRPTHIPAASTEGFPTSRLRSIRTRRTLQARIVVDNPGEKLKKDMYCTVTVTAGSISNVDAVPDSSVLRDDNNQPFVYVATGANQFGRRDVELGESQDGQTQILKGFPLERGCRRRQLVSSVCQFAATLRRAVHE